MKKDFYNTVLDGLYADVKDIVDRAKFEESYRTAVINELEAALYYIETAKNYMENVADLYSEAINEVEFLSNVRINLVNSAAELMERQGGDK